MSRIAQGLASNGVGANEPKPRTRKRKTIAPGNAGEGTSSSMVTAFIPPTLNTGLTPINATQHNQQLTSRTTQDQVAEPLPGISRPNDAASRDRGYDISSDDE